MRNKNCMGLRTMKSCLTGAGVSAGLILFSFGLSPLYAQFNGPALTLPTRAPEMQQTTDDPSLLVPHLQDYAISVGDVLTVRLLGATDYTPTVKISVDGTVLLPLIGVIKLDGLTVEQASLTIATQLRVQGFYNDPQVTIEVVAAVNQYATITGEIHAVIPLLGTRRLFDVLAAGTAGFSGSSANANITTAASTSSGGWPPNASHVITIIRQGEANPIVVNIGTDPAKVAAANIVIKPHDLIVISKVGVVYVVGAFARQGAIPLDQNTPLTLLEATALTGGEGFEGKFKDLRIIRTNGLSRTVTTVNIRRIEKGLDPDPILQADDILFLPTVLWKAAIKAGGIQTITSIADIALLAIEANR